MKLIGAGLPRTGTLSQKIALEMLGFAPCYHMVNVLTDLDETTRWRQAVDGDLSQDTVPAERLLFWSVGDGWEPLCEFLEVPVPEADFPRVNDSAQFGDRIIDGAIDAVQRHRREGAVVV